MNLTCIGTCRLRAMKAEKIYTDMLEINLIHSTKDILQFLKWCFKKINISDEMTSYIFHSGIWKGKPVILNDGLINLMNNTDVFIIEISSYKSYKYENFYCHTDILNCSSNYPNFLHIPKMIYENIKMEKYDKNELENDINEIISLVNKKIIIVTHVLAEKDFDKISERSKLINDLIEICSRKKIPIVIPGEILNNNKNIIQSDYQHYTEEGLIILKKFYHDKISNILSQI